MLDPMLLRKIFFQISSHQKQLQMKLVFGSFILLSSLHLTVIDLFLLLFSDETYEENVLEKQADLIRYLRERNEHLSRLVLRYKHPVDTERSIINHRH